MEEIFKEMGVAIDDFFAEADEFIENYKENHSFDVIPLDDINEEIMTDLEEEMIYDEYMYDEML